MPYKHLGLTRWPFPVVPDPRFCDFVADRERIRADLDSLLRNLSRQDASSIHLLWSWFGAGKTHTLFYLANRAAEMSQASTVRLHTMYTEFPKSTRSFLDLYRSFALALDVDAIGEAYLEICTSPESQEFLRGMRMASPDLVNALQVVVTGRAADQVTAMRWLRGETLPVSGFRAVGIAQKISSSEEAGRILTALVRLLALAARSQDRSLCRVVWFLDELQRIERLPASVRAEICAGLHSAFNASPAGLTIVLSFSGHPSTHLPEWLTSELRDRIGRTKVMVLPPMLSEEGLTFVRDLFAHYRTPEACERPPFSPFTEEACRFIVDDIQRMEELKPRAIMHAFNAVLQEADPLLETGEMQDIGIAFARRVLAEYVRPANPEDE